jgi:hypothetical protein
MILGLHRQGLTVWGPICASVHWPGLTGRRLWRELRERGYEGGYTAVTDVLTIFVQHPCPPLRSASRPPGRMSHGGVIAQPAQNASPARTGGRRSRRRRLRRPRRCVPIRMSCQCQAWTNARNTTDFQCGASQTRERRSQAQHGNRCFPVSAAALRPAQAGPASHHRSMARGAAACMGARWDQAPREATRTRLSMAATLARLLRNARPFENWYGRRASCSYR